MALVLAFRLAARLGGAAGGAVAVVALLLAETFASGVVRGNSEGLLVALVLLGRGPSPRRPPPGCVRRRCRRGAAAPGGVAVPGPPGLVAAARRPCGGRARARPDGGADGGGGRRGARAVVHPGDASAPGTSCARPRARSSPSRARRRSPPARSSPSSSTPAPALAYPVYLLALARGRRGLAAPRPGRAAGRGRLGGVDARRGRAGRAGLHGQPALRHRPGRDALRRGGRRGPGRWPPGCGRGGGSPSPRWCSRCPAWRSPWRPRPGRRSASPPTSASTTPCPRRSSAPAAPAAVNRCGVVLTGPFQTQAVAWELERRQIAVGLRGDPPGTVLSRSEEGVGADARFGPELGAGRWVVRSTCAP